MKQSQQHTKKSYINLECHKCGKSFERRISKYNWYVKNGRTRFYCSRSCANDRMVGENNPGWVGGKIKDNTCVNCENVFMTYENEPARKGLFCSLDCYFKYSVGDKSHSWRGGTTNLNKAVRSSSRYIEWKNDILERDNSLCIKCNSDQNVGVHHHVSFMDIVTRNNIATKEEAMRCSELWNTDNGITLCLFHHNEEHGRIIK